MWLDRMRRRFGGLPMVTVVVSYHHSTHCPPSRSRFLLTCLVGVVANLLMALTPAVADSLAEARVTYTAGQFFEAAKKAEVVGTSEGYTLAAKSMTLFGRYIARDDQKKLLFERAMELAAKAMESDPENPEAYLEWTRAMGRHSFQVSKVTATKENYAGKTRAAIESAIRINPQMASAHISLGRWHVGIIDRVGEFLARVTYGAKKKSAIDSFERALALKPKTKADIYSLAVGYEALDSKTYQNRVFELVQRAIEMPVSDAYDRIIHRKAVEHLRILNTSKGG